MNYEKIINDKARVNIADGARAWCGVECPEGAEPERIYLSKCLTVAVCASYQCHSQPKQAKGQRRGEDNGF
jgi:hypothetical protein